MISDDTFLSNENTYLLSGNVFVTNGAKLTIQEGTIIRCDAEKSTSLLVTRGSKLIAVGNRKFPIVFTSSKKEKARASGDWGGIIILGSAKINNAVGTAVVERNFNPKYSVYGGENNEEETAILKYVRIEFPGKKINKHKELNGLSLCAIGSKTILENIMVSYSLDDSYEWYGGAGTYQNLISLKSKDDDFDFTQGFKGRLINPLAVRHPFISDVSGSYAVEIDGYDSSGFSTDSELSSLIIENGTFINLVEEANIQFAKPAISSKKLAKIKVLNSSISGFSQVMRIDSSFKNQNELDHKLLLTNNIFNISDSKGVKSKNINKFNLVKLFKTNKFTNFYLGPNDMYIDPFNEDAPSFIPKKVSLTTML